MFAFLQFHQLLIHFSFENSLLLKLFDFHIFHLYFHYNIPIFSIFLVLFLLLFLFCFLFRLNRIGIPEALEEFLANEKVLKIGLSLRDDFGAMRKRTDIQPANFLDLQNYVGQFGIEDASLQKIYAILFNKKISKGQRLSNWEADVLSDAQKKYAALDAWACLKIYNQLKQI